MTLTELMHSTAHDLGIITNTLNNFENKYKEILTDEMLEKLHKIKQAKKDLLDKLDLYYITEKNKK